MNITHAFRSVFAVGAILAAAVVPAARAGLLIDDFITQQDVLVTALATQATPVTAGAYVYPTATALGGERDLLLTKYTGSSVAQARLRTNPNGLDRLRFSQGTNVRSVASVIYDGVDSNAQAINYAGLGGLDFTRYSAFRLEVTASNQIGLTHFTVWDASDPTGATFATANLWIPVITTTTFLDLSFANFTAVGGDLNDIFANIGAIRFTVDGNFANVQGKTAVAGWDADFGSIQAIPSPSALLGSSSVA